MKNILLIIIAYIVIVILSSCNPSRQLCYKLYPVVADTSTNAILLINNEVDIDTIVIPADTSAWLQQLFECDSFGNAQISELKSRIGLRSALQINTIQQGKHAIITTVACKCDSETIYHIMQSHDTTSRALTTITKTVQVPVPADLTWGEKFKITYGGYALGLDGLILLVLLLWLAWKIFKVATPQGAAISAGEGALSWLGKLLKK